MSAELSFKKGFLQKRARHGFNAGVYQQKYFTLDGRTLMRFQTPTDSRPKEVVMVDSTCTAKKGTSDQTNVGETR